MQGSLLKQVVSGMERSLGEQGNLAGITGAGKGDWGAWNAT